MDTHIWHWWINQIQGRLSSGIVDLIEQADKVAISVFEMAWLVRHGRIDLGGEFEAWFEDVIESECVKFLPITPQIASSAVALPEHHKDPQDRPIIAAALVENAQLLSFDTGFPAYLELQGRLIGRDF